MVALRPHAFINELKGRATAGGARQMLFPEVDGRMREAADVLRAEKLAEPVFPEIDEKRANELEKLFLDIRASKKGTKDELSADEAKRLARDPLYYGMYLLQLGEADGLVAGVSRPTADVLRAALWLIGKAEGIQTVSSAMYMLLPDFRGHGEEVLTFADCAVVPEPTAEQLTDIAIASADARQSIVGDEPRVAMLSYSTHGSGVGASVDKVKQAAELVRSKRSDIVMDGELQADAALIESVAIQKASSDILKGNANVLIFPSLDSANIAYKLVARLVPGALAIGPILQGLKKPVSDLSRGASVEDIVITAAIVALQAADSK